MQFTQEPLAQIQSTNNKWITITQEVEHHIKTSYVGDVNHKFLVDFFGLNEPDVEWYGIEIKDEEEQQ